MKSAHSVEKPKKILMSSAAALALALALAAAGTNEEGKQQHVVACSASRSKHCCGDGLCAGAETIDNCLADCPGVTTAEMCGEEPHSDRGGRTVAFGVGHRAASAQECCDKCTAHSKKDKGRPCNSWTFCGYPVCWGLDTGWNHTFGECWLRHLDEPSKPTFGQRGAYSAEYRQKMLHTRRACVDDRPGGMSEGWSCPPTHVPWTSGSLHVPRPDPSIKWETSGGWGNMRIHMLGADGAPIDASCTCNQGAPCDPKVLGHAGRSRRALLAAPAAAAAMLPTNHTVVATTMSAAAPYYYLTTFDAATPNERYYTAIGLSPSPKVLWTCSMHAPTGTSTSFGGTPNTSLAAPTGEGLYVYVNEGGASGYCGYQLSLVDGPRGDGSGECAYKWSSATYINDCSRVVDQPPALGDDGSIYSTRLKQNNGAPLLLAHDASTGAEQWRYPSAIDGDGDGSGGSNDDDDELQGPLSQASVSSGRIYFTSATSLHCVQEADGRACADHTRVSALF